MQLQKFCSIEKSLLFFNWYQPEFILLSAFPLTGTEGEEEKEDEEEEEKDKENADGEEAEEEEAVKEEEEAAYENKVKWYSISIFQRTVLTWNGWYGSFIAHTF